jgi:D-3-phosphoglycerate dehydrogenase
MIVDKKFFGKILVTEANEIADEAVQMLKEHGFEVLDEVQNNGANHIQGLFIRTYTQVTGDYLDKYPDLKFILRAGVGTDNIDLEECKLRNIEVFNAPGSNANAVAEYILTMSLLLLRNIPQQTEMLKNHLWRERSFIGGELAGKTFGLVGCGAVGKTLATKLQVFGPKMLGYDPFVDEETLNKFSVKKTDLEEILTEADVITLQLPLNQKTKNMFTKDQFIQMKKMAYLVNVSRGELINEDDLIWALKNQVVAGAALDVFKDEPNVNPEFLKIPNLILTPHIAGFTKEANIQMATGAVENLLKSTTSFW